MIVDLKTGSPAKWHRLQVAAYEHLDPVIVPTFHESTHSYFVDGRRVPSVTQILFDLGEISEFSTWNELARDVGTAVHACCALLPDKLDFAEVDPRALPYVLSYLEWESRGNYTIKAKEQRGYNKYFGYAGTFDLETVEGYGNATLYLRADGGLANLKKYETGRADWYTFISMVNVWKWRFQQ